MMNPRKSLLIAGLPLILLTAFLVRKAMFPTVIRVANLPNAINSSPTVAGNQTGTETAVLAGGCFWGVEAVFEHVKGVTDVVSGYSGGDGKTATYGQVGSGDTGHAESVKITYDPTQISYGQLLKIYFSVAHDPTQVNRQGPDSGTQYRSAIFFATPNQQKIAQAYIAQLNRAKVFSQPIATQVLPLNQFYPAEGCLSRCYLVSG